MRGLRVLVGLAIALLSGSAMSKELTFKFDVYSSGPMIYACNAGLRHLPPGQNNRPAQICHWAGRPATAANLCQAGQHNCVCTGVDGGAYLMDFMRYKSYFWQPGPLTNSSSGWNLASPQIGAKKASNTTTYAQIIPTTGLNSNPLYNLLDEVTFNLGSETYGADFFVDICFRGSQIDYYFADERLNVTTSNSLIGRITATDVDTLGTHPNDPIRPGPGGVPGTSSAYLSLSDLGGRAVAICDLQGKGALKFAHNGSSAENGVYDTLDSDLNFLYEPGNDFFNSSGNYQTVTTSTLTLFNTWINYDSYFHPRFCKIRYYFSERSFAERKWQRHDTRIITKSIIEEAALNPNNN